MNWVCQVFSFLIMVSFGLSSWAQVNDVYNPNDPGRLIPGERGPVFPGPSNTVIFDNGPLVNSPGTGVGGADESLLNTALKGLGLFGFGHQFVNMNSIADDFTLTQSVTLTDLNFYAYQTGSSTTSTITGLYFRIWDDLPGAPGSNIIFGDLITNRLSNTMWSGAYRVTDNNTGVSNDRPIMVNTASLEIPLDAGTYWIEWQTDGSLGSGPWAPPITINGSPSTGNGLQSLDGGNTFSPAIDNGFAQGFPFVFEGTVECMVESISLRGDVIAINGNCSSGVDLYFRNDQSGTVLVSSNIAVDGVTSITLNTVAPDAIYFVTPTGDPDTILAETSRTVPTLGELGFVVFILLLLASGVFFLRKNRRGAMN